MARKRNSSDMDPEASPVRRGTVKGEDLERELAYFCYEAKIDLPQTPVDPRYTEKKHQVASQYRALWYKNSPALRRVVLQFSKSCPDVNAVSEDAKVTLLSNLLKEPATKAVTPRTTRFRNVLSERAPLEVDDDPPSPSSPTAGVKGIRRHFRGSKQAANVPHAKIEQLQPGTPRSIQAESLHHSDHASMFCAPKPPAAYSRNSSRAARSDRETASACTSFTTNANTSFATTAPNTSFGSSFQSHAGPTGSQDTAASSFDEKCHTAVATHSKSAGRKSNCLSWLSTNGVAELQNACLIAESPQLSDETIKPRLQVSPTIPTFGPLYQSRYSGESQSTDYGSLAPSDLDTLMREEHIYLDLEHSKTVSQDVAMTDAIDAEGAAQRNSDYRHPQVYDQQSSILPHLSLTRVKCAFAELPGPDFLQSLPFDAQWEARRVLQSDVMPAAELESRWNVPRTLEGLYTILSEDGARFRASLQTTIERETITFGARLEWMETKSAFPFKMVLDRPKQDVSCALQRLVGAEHVLYMEIPNLQKPPSIHKSKDVLASFHDFTSQPQYFLGRTWMMLFLQPNKKRGERKTCRTIWISGSGKMSFLQIIHRLLPLDKNTHQRASKFHMRIELWLSRTLSVATIRPDEIAYQIEDLKATNEPDDRRFEKPDCSGCFYERYDPSVVMNDGCNMASPWLFYEYAKQKGLSTVPSAIQCRVAGSKGVWISENEDVLRERPQGTLLWISDSQAKIIRDPHGADDEWLSMNVVKQNNSPQPSYLYTAFLPILINGGISPEAIREEVRDQVRADGKMLIDAIEDRDTISLRRWMQSNNSVREAKNRNAGIQTVGGFPINREERIIQMLQSGFDPKQCCWLSREVKHMAERAFDLKEKRFQIRLAQSTTLMGIADPYGCLKPGEVHISFENAFPDPVTGMPLMFLDGLDGLVARNPALGPWDIQKVSFVYKQRLRRFRNLVVFPSRGMRPLAGKLQGGDYDGDQFWITWSKRLTADFKNTPAPWQPPPPEDFGITIDRRTVAKFVQDSENLEQWHKFLSTMNVTRMLESASAMLGQVTLELEKLNYAQGTIDSAEARKMIPVHDYLADADKNGYRYSPEAFRKWMEQEKIPTNSPNPRYWQFTRDQPDLKMTAKDKKEKEVVYYPANQTRVAGNIIDSVYFDVVKPLIDDILQQVSRTLGDAGKFDDDLVKFHNQTWNSAEDGSYIRQQLKSLEGKFKTLRKYWQETKNVLEFEDRVRGVRTIYEEILPDAAETESDRATLTEWMRRQGHDFTLWERLRASTLAKHQCFGNESAGQLMFLSAGRELCYLKSMELDSSTQFMLPSYYDAHKVRPAPKIEKVVDDYDSDAVDDDDEGFGGKRW